MSEENRFTMKKFGETLMQLKEMKRQQEQLECEEVISDSHESCSSNSDSSESDSER
jgi:hypothetical protein